MCIAQVQNQQQPNEVTHSPLPLPTAFTPEPVRRRVAGMKQILLMIAVVAAQSGSM
jgi:hypothetical protein